MKQLYKIIEIITKACGSFWSIIYQRRDELENLVVLEYKHSWEN